MLGAGTRKAGMLQARTTHSQQRHEHHEHERDEERPAGRLRTKERVSRNLPRRREAADRSHPSARAVNRAIPWRRRDGGSGACTPRTRRRPSCRDRAGGAAARSTISLMRPGRADMTMTRSARKAASGMEWVMKTMVLPDSFQMRRSSRFMNSRVMASRAPKGSSMRSSEGSCTSARAMATR